MHALELGVVSTYQKKELDIVSISIVFFLGKLQKALLNFHPF
jgi:hypothetical protein